MLRRLGAGVLALFLSSPAVAGQHEGHQPAPRPTPKVEPAPQPAKVLGWEPIRCWRQSSAGAIAVGEAFTVTLTCAVYDADNAQVIPDESRLGVASIQMAPFEILGGSHPPDVRRGSRRFFQYDYELRIISPDAIGHDVNIPALALSYRIQSRVGAAATLEGRDLSYLMPMMPIKVLSLVPADADDIRDASAASLAAVDSLRFRSRVFSVLTLTFAALAAVMVAWALVPLARTRKAVSHDRDRAPAPAVLDAAAADLSEALSGASAGGWDDGTIARVLAGMRLIAAAAIDHPFSQKPMAGATAPGRLPVQFGLLRKTSVTVSSGVTAADVASARAGRGLSTTRQQQLEGLESGLLTMTTALYRREPVRDAATLEEAARQAIAVARAVAGEKSRWPGR